MVLIETSAWVEYLRDTGSTVCNEVDRLLAEDTVTTDPVVMEVLAGARGEAHLQSLRGLVGRSRLVHCRSDDFEAAAALYRQCRATGMTVRQLTDCLIAAVAIRSGVPVLHHDTDFDVLARLTPLTVHSPT